LKINIDHSVNISEAASVVQGRPTEFDRQAALEKAMSLFWRYGYEGTSLSKLLDEMGIRRQSLYNAFGDKHTLFVEAVNHYNSQVTQRLLDILMASGSGLRNIRKALELSASFASGKDYCGCFLTNSIVELAPHNKEVAEIVYLANKRITSAFKAALDAAIKSGEISADTDTRAVARFLNSTMHGIVVSGKASYGKTAITDIVKVALSIL